MSLVLKAFSNPALQILTERTGLPLAAVGSASVPVLKMLCAQSTLWKGMRFIEASINKMKDYLSAGEHFRLPLRRDMRPCQSFITVKVASKRNEPSTRPKHVPCITVVCHFLVATYRCAWAGGGLAVFSVCWCLILYFLAISQHLRETKLTDGMSPALRRVSRSTGTLRLLRLQVRWLQ